MIYLISIVMGTISVILGEWVSLILFYIIAWLYEIIFKASGPEDRIPTIYISRFISGLIVGLIHGLLIYLWQLNGWIYYLLILFY
jgi:hypothetical protein